METIESLNEKIRQDYAPAVAAGLVTEDQIPQYKPIWSGLTTGLSLLSHYHAGPGLDYSIGYEEGSRRRHHGAEAISDQSHEHWMALGLAEDSAHRHRDRGDGYRDAIAGRPPRGCEDHR